MGLVTVELIKPDAPYMSFILKKDVALLKKSPNQIISRLCQHLRMNEVRFQLLHINTMPSLLLAGIYL